MSGFGDFLEKELLDHVFGAAVYTAPATVYICLFTATPTDVNASGTEVVSAGGYGRVALTNNTTNWPAATGTSPAVKSNGVAVTFAAPTTNWGTVVAFGVKDASTAGNTLGWGPLSVSKTINNGDAAPSFAVGAFQITLD